MAGVLLAISLAACGAEHRGAPSGAQNVPPSRGYYKIGAPYQVEGVWYYPGVDNSYDETGIASWYGPDFHGKYTANGEVYNMNDLTAAHPTLPLPSVVRVTNLDNGRSIVVRVNDRGPYVRGRIIDLSRRAAQLIGMIGTGTAKVRVQILPDESRQAVLLAQQGEIPSAERIASAQPTERVSAVPLAAPPGTHAATVEPIITREVPSPPPPAAAVTPPIAPSASGMLIASAQAATMPPPPPAARPAASAPDPVAAVLAQTVTTVPVRATSIYVQVGAFSQYDNANRLRGKLAAMGGATITEASVDGQAFFRVRVGPAASVDDADRLLGRVVQAGFHDARIVVE